MHTDRFGYEWCTNHEEPSSLRQTEEQYLKSIENDESGWILVKTMKTSQGYVRWWKKKVPTLTELLNQ
jgi:hypothetical protein